MKQQQAHKPNCACPNCTINNLFEENQRLKEMIRDIVALWKEQKSLKVRLEKAKTARMYRSTGLPPFPENMTLVTEELQNA